MFFTWENIFIDCIDPRLEASNLWSASQKGVSDCERGELRDTRLARIADLASRKLPLRGRISPLRGRKGVFLMSILTSFSASAQSDASSSLGIALPFWFRQHGGRHCSASSLSAAALR